MSNYFERDTCVPQQATRCADDSFAALPVARCCLKYVYAYAKVVNASYICTVDVVSVCFGVLIST